MSNLPNRLDEASATKIVSHPSRSNSLLSYKYQQPARHNQNAPDEEAGGDAVPSPRAPRARQEPRKARVRDGGEVQETRGHAVQAAEAQGVAADPDAQLGHRLVCARGAHLHPDRHHPAHRVGQLRRQRRERVVVSQHCELWQRVLPRERERRQHVRLREARLPHLVRHREGHEGAGVRLLPARQLLPEPPPLRAVAQRRAAPRRRGRERRGLFAAQDDRRRCAQVQLDDRDAAREHPGELYAEPVRLDREQSVQRHLLGEQSHAPEQGQVLPGRHSGGQEGREPARTVGHCVEVGRGHQVQEHPGERPQERGDVPVAEPPLPLHHPDVRRAGAGGQQDGVDRERAVVRRAGRALYCVDAHGRAAELPQALRADRHGPPGGHEDRVSRVEQLCGDDVRGQKVARDVDDILVRRPQPVPRHRVHRGRRTLHDAGDSVLREAQAEPPQAGRHEISRFMEPPPSAQYELLEKIGGGAFGEVHLARHVLSDSRCAIKRLRVHDDGRLAVLPAAHFQEIEALRQLDHPNIVKLWDVFADGAYLSLVFEFVETDLFSIIRRQQQPFADADVRGLMRMLLHAVAHCHDKAIVHRDAKELPDFDKVSFPSYKPIPLARLFLDASRDAVDLLAKLLVLDPKKRLSARQVRSDALVCFCVSPRGSASPLDLCESGTAAPVLLRRHAQLALRHHGATGRRRGCGLQDPTER
ncbi:hypothetical protein PybrP1_002503 [[Pythium] brassicae (nom. inval.)]|nr:hypothetical protein PybrP1_002503 [[Pythium] brassicae (nom. inval.)]